MQTWIFQGNPIKFKLDEYILNNETIWWSIRQAHLADDIQLGDEVFIWRSDGGERGSGGIVARTVVITLPQEYKNDDESAMFWYEDVSGDTYLAVELRVLEVDVEVGINRFELAEHPNLADLMILRLKQNTNYLVDEKHKSYLKQLWYSRYAVNDEDITTRFPLVESVEQVKMNMEQFGKDLVEIEELAKQLKSFQQWYYIYDGELLAPSKFIGYQEMKGHMYVDKQAIAELDGRVTESALKQWFEPIKNEVLEKTIKLKLDNRVRKDITINVLKSERNQIESIFTQLPPLKSNGRVREYNFYSDELKGKVIYEHLINSKTHRWMDIHVLGRDGSTNGRESANILYYLGMKADYRGIFDGKSMDEVIQILEHKGTDYADVVRFLRILDDAELDNSINSDFEAEQVEEGHGIEGSVKYYYGKRYERDTQNRRLAIKQHGLNCYACGFNFEKVYGERGKDFIEVHHINPLSTLEVAVEINPKTDLVPLCANCHRMIHRRKDEILTIDELREILKRNKRD